MIYAWEAGSVSGVGYTLDEAKGAAGPHVTAETPGLVEEAEVGLAPAAHGGKVPAMTRTGRSWRGRATARGTAWEACEGTA